MDQKPQDRMNRKDDMDDNGHYHNHDHAHCNGMMCWGGHRFSVLRFVLLLLLVAFVFSVGVKFGELEGQIEAGYGHMSDRGGYDMQQYGGGYMDSGYMNGSNGGMMNERGMPMQEVSPAHPMMPATGPMDATSTMYH
jgi:hypothetical protein